MRVHEDGERCPKAPRRRQRDARGSREPHRAAYGKAQYRRNRQIVLGKTKGRCAACGKAIARKSDGHWVMEGGDVHHMRALSEGGGNEVANLVPLCRSCHAKADKARRERGETW